jgi:ATP-dependent Clp protease ATP-binding subunit ClpA
VVEYRKYVEKMRSSDGCKPSWSEPSVEQTIDISAVSIKKHHGVGYTPEALEAAASFRTVHYRPIRQGPADEVQERLRTEQSEMEMEMNEE